MKFHLSLLLLCAFVSCSDSSSSAPLTSQEANELEEVLFFEGYEEFSSLLDGGDGYTKDKQEALRSLITRSTEQRETYDNGQVKSEGHALNDGTKVWLWKTWHENGQLESEGHYKSGAREGRWEFYYEHGLDRYYGNYKVGERVGEWVSCTPGEYSDSKGTYTPQMGFGFKDGRLAEWTVETETTENGVTVTSRGMVDSNTGVRLSTWVSWYESGQMKSEGFYIEGEPNGLFTYWYENGQKRMESRFKNGVAEWLDTGWYENGQKSSERSYKDGKREGLYTAWHKNGQKQCEGMWKDNKQIGVHTFWHEDGTLEGKDEFD